MLSLDFFIVRETPSVFQATKMLLNIHFVSYFIDEDAVMFLWHCNAVLILGKKKRKTSCLMVLNVSQELPASFSEQK